MEKDRPSLRSSGNSKGYVFVSMSMNIIRHFSDITSTLMLLKSSNVTREM